MVIFHSYVSLPEGISPFSAFSHRSVCDATVATCQLYKRDGGSGCNQTSAQWTRPHLFSTICTEKSCAHNRGPCRQLRQNKCSMWIQLLLLLPSGCSPVDPGGSSRSHPLAWLPIALPESLSDFAAGGGRHCGGPTWHSPQVPCPVPVPVPTFAAQPPRFVAATAFQPR